MKASFTKVIRILLSILFAFFLIQSLAILRIVTTNNLAKHIQIDIQNTIILTLFVGFIFFIIIYLSIPTLLKKSFFEIRYIINEISKGNYKIDPSRINNKSSDKEFRNTADLMTNMIVTLRKFDDLKKEKILEHRNRILAMMKLSSDGFIITNGKGDVVYVNQALLKEFPELDVDVNIRTTHFSPAVEKSIKKYAVEVLRNKSKLDDQKQYSPNLKKHIDLASAIIRNTKGEMIGSVIAVSNLDKRKDKKENENG